MQWVFLLAAFQARSEESSHLITVDLAHVAVSARAVSRHFVYLVTACKHPEQQTRMLQLAWFFTKMQVDRFFGIMLALRL